MTRENLTRWTCDRCGHAVDVGTTSASPIVWGGWLKGNLPGMDPEQRIDLCNPCEVRIRHFIKQDPAWALFDRFTDLASDYFSRPAGASGNPERARLAREAWQRSYDFEMDSTPFYEAGYFCGPASEWATDGSLTGTPNPEAAR